MLVATVGNVLVWAVWIAAAFACLGSGVAVVSFSNPFYSALALIGNLASLAVLYLLLSAEFVAAAQVLVYAGAVMVMFLFVIAYIGPRTRVAVGGRAELAGGRRRARGRRAARRDRRRRSASRRAAASRTRADDRRGASAARPRSASSSSPTTCSPSRSRRSCCSSRRSAASSSARTRAADARRRCRRCDAGPERRLVPRRRRVPVRDGRARRAPPPQPADRPALARDHAQRRQPRPDRASRATSATATARSSRSPSWPSPRRRSSSASASSSRSTASGVTLDVDRLEPAPRMIAGAWICLLSPLAGRVADHARRKRAARAARAGYLATLSVLVAFGGALASSSALLGRSAGDRERRLRPPGRGSPAGSYHVGLRGPDRPALRVHDADRLRASAS